ncbi:hypothetical protein RRG08_020573 [Elysia crispata]|uniref:Uncharacterized protein n=1 Tax=Elysia crispata TaxID=231223 RepID=A0AAE1A6I3_9GAST|nr:hypothetical protein RRG08_020573 [Elysia crispata]
MALSLITASLDCVPVLTTRQPAAPASSDDQSSQDPNQFKSKTKTDRRNRVTIEPSNSRRCEARVFWLRVQLGHGDGTACFGGHWPQLAKLRRFLLAGQPHQVVLARIVLLAGTGNSGRGVVGAFQHFTLRYENTSNHLDHPKSPCSVCFCRDLATSPPEGFTFRQAERHKSLL